MQLDPIAFARQLIDIPSTTENELEVGEFLDRELTRLGFMTRRHYVTETRFNLLATTAAQPRVVFNTHIDTVPPWFASSEDETHIYGRGACDTKGVLAAMIAAGVKLRDEGIDEFAFLLVVAEETDSIGAKTANVEFANLGSKFVIVGEPTESTFVKASKGACTIVARFEGIAGHSAYPERGDSAIHKMVAALTEVLAHDWGQHEVLGQTTVNVGIVRGGQKPNIISADAEAEMIFRTVGEPEAIRLGVEAIIGKHGGSVVKMLGNPPQFMHVPAGEESMVVSFNTDVPHLKNLGQPLLYGPGSILDAHGANEKIAKADILAAVERYRKLVMELLEIQD
jgi:acetylornithine deacetylase